MKKVKKYTVALNHSRLTLALNLNLVIHCFFSNWHVALRTADELSKIMAFFYYGAAKPPFLNVTGDVEETIPTVQISNKQG